MAIQITDEQIFNVIIKMLKDLEYSEINKVILFTASDDVRLLATTEKIKRDIQYYRDYNDPDRAEDKIKYYLDKIGIASEYCKIKLKDLGVEEDDNTNKR